MHTRYSLDASTQGTRTSPAQAYLFARGEQLPIQPWTEDGRALRSLQLRRPLDFAMVSDHAELIGEVHMCNQPGVEGFDSWQCRVYRKWPRVAYYMFNFMATIQHSHLSMCGEQGERCLAAALAPWQEMQEAAEASYDRSTECSFTTFVGYEWTGMSGYTGGNLHRNVVFRNATVPRLPASFIDEPAAPRLWDSLDRHCNQAGEGCDSLVIPHTAAVHASNSPVRPLLIELFCVMTSKISPKPLLFFLSAPNRNVFGIFLRQRVVEMHSTHLFSSLALPFMDAFRYGKVASCCAACDGAVVDTRTRFDQRSRDHYANCLQEL